MARPRTMRNIRTNEDAYDIDNFMYDDDLENPENLENIDDIENDFDDEDSDMFEDVSSPAKPMADDKIRLECLKIAINVAKLAKRTDVITVADELFKFVKG